MKRIVSITYLLLTLFAFSYANTNDSHLCRAINYINKGQFQHATRELSFVSDWTFEEDACTRLNEDSTFNFLSYASKLGFNESKLDSMGIYLAKQYFHEAEDFYEAQDLYNAILSYDLGSYLDSIVFGAKHPIYSRSQLMIGDIYAEQNNNTEAKTYYLKALNSIDYNTTEAAYLLTETYRRLGDLNLSEKNTSEAITNYLQAIKLYIGLIKRDKLSNRYQKGYFHCLLYIANIFQDSHKYTIAEQYYITHSEASAKFRGKQSPEYLSSLLYLGLFYQTTEDYNKSELAYEEALHVAEESIFGKKNPFYSSILEKLGELKEQLGDPDKAFDYFMLALEYEGLINGRQTESYARILIRIASLMADVEGYQQAEKLLSEAQEIILATSGKHSSSYCSILNLLADIAFEQEDYNKAESYIMESFRLKDEPSGIDIANMAILFEKKGAYEKAEEYFTTALNYIKNTIGTQHKNYALVTYRFSTFYIHLQDWAKADEYLSTSIAIFKQQFLKSLEYMSEQQRLNYFETFDGLFKSKTPRFTYRYNIAKQAGSNLAYDNELFYKGVLLESSESIRRSILQSGDTSLINKWNELTELKITINHLQETDPTSDQIANYENQAEQLEKEITRSSAAYRENQRQWNITWDSVRAELKPNQVAIEYMAAPLNEDSTMYCALLLRDTCSYPILIPLFEQKQATSLISDDEGETYSYDENGASLASLVWSKVLPYIKPGESVYFAPTGLLHQLAIEALPYDASRTMDDVFNLVRVSSTRELVVNHSSETHTSATLYGGIQYDMNASDMEVGSRQYQGEQLLASRSFGAADINRGHANYLPGTKSEAEQINQLLSENNVKAHLYTDNAANEESFKALSGKHQNVIHIATHGFFWTDSTAQRQKYFSQHNMLTDDDRSAPPAIDPLNRCGLLFAGANIALQGYSEELPEGVQDGILTAKEISLLDLRDANLVVLSACETGKGEITGDGVFGLQRAFKMAGAQTIIMSLWPVNDDATQLLMTEFYRNWITLRQPKREAFRSARNTVRTRYKEPTYWAGFIMLD